MANKKLNAKQRALQDAWETIKKTHESVTSFAGKYKGVPLPKKQSKKLEMGMVFAPPPRQVNTEGFVIKSVPMGAGGTVPYDPTLEEAKAALSHRVGPLYNKGGPQYISDGDMGDVKAGLTRRRS